MMEKEFIPYEQALALKELGFEEICLGFYDPNHEYLYIVGNALNYNFISTLPESLKVKNPRLRDISAPLYQQAFRWIREEHNIEVSIICHRYTSKKFYQGTIDDIDDAHSYGLGKSLTYEETELLCLKKVIEILKDKKSI
jgi:hypothetical protein